MPSTIIDSVAFPVFVGLEVSKVSRVMLHRIRRTVLLARPG
jgi:hypothetical protein